MTTLNTPLLGDLSGLQDQDQYGKNLQTIPCPFLVINRPVVVLVVVEVVVEYLQLLLKSPNWILFKLR